MYNLKCDKKSPDCCDNFYWYLVVFQTYLDLNAYIWLCNDCYFKDPNSFHPERWLRHSPMSTITDPYILNPFSIGTRMCAGLFILFSLFYISSWSRFFFYICRNCLLKLCIYEELYVIPYIFIGRRFAEQDLYVGLCRLLLKFHVVTTDNTPPQQEWSTLLRPKASLPLQFIHRK